MIIPVLSGCFAGSESFLPWRPVYVGDFDHGNSEKAHCWVKSTSDRPCLKLASFKEDQRPNRCNAASHVGAAVLAHVARSGRLAAANTR